MPAGLPILMFHAIDDASSATCFSPTEFRAALVDLRQRGVLVLRFVEAAAQLQSGQAPSEPSVVLTFDDGDATVYERAWPLLAEHGMSATVFVLPEARGDRARTRTLCGRRLLTSARIKEMHRAGIEIGSHTLHHPLLPRLPDAAVEDEVRCSRQALEDLLGARVSSFAYPFGRHDRRSRLVVGRHHIYACTDALALARPGCDVLAVPRVDAYYLRGKRWVDKLGSPRFSWYLRLRDIPRRMRRLAFSPFAPRAAVEVPPAENAAGDRGSP